MEGSLGQARAELEREWSMLVNDGSTAYTDREGSRQSS